MQRSTQRYMTGVLASVAFLAVVLISGCALTGANPNQHPTTQPATLADTGNAISQAVGTVGAAVTPFNPALGTILTCIGFAGAGFFDSLRQRVKVKKLSAPRVAWTDAQRETARAAKSAGIGSPPILAVTAIPGVAS